MITCKLGGTPVTFRLPTLSEIARFTASIIAGHKTGIAELLKATCSSPETLEAHPLTLMSIWGSYQMAGVASVVSASTKPLILSLPDGDDFRTVTFRPLTLSEVSDYTTSLQSGILSGQVFVSLCQSAARPKGIEDGRVAWMAQQLQRNPWILYVVVMTEFIGHADDLEVDDAFLAQLG